MPSVSIVIPAYNPGPYLKEAVRSVLAQTYEDWELIVVDDGSTEDLSWLDSIEPRVRRLRQGNLRAAAARNHGITSARSDLIAFLDADDAWLPHKLQKQVEQLRARPDAILTHCQARHIDEHGHEGGLGWGGGYETYEQLLDGCGVYPSCVLMRREILFRCGLFNPALINTEDYDLWLKATRYGPMVADPEPLALYRVHATNTSRNYEATHLSACTILQTHLDVANYRGQQDIAAKCRRGLERTHRSAALQGIDAAFHALKNKNFRAAFKHWRAGLRISPLRALLYSGQRLASYARKKSGGGAPA